jgi:hypothetical protein
MAGVWLMLLSADIQVASDCDWSQVRQVTQQLSRNMDSAQGSSSRWSQLRYQPLKVSAEIVTQQVWLPARLSVKQLMKQYV